MMPDRGDGACTYLTEDNLCSIYATRPDLCNMEKMWVQRNKELDFDARGITKKAYFKFNNEFCNKMMNDQGIDKKFNIDLKVYDEMSEETVRIVEIPTNKKPKIEIHCIKCEDPMIVTSIIKENGQVNIACKNFDCKTTGFINRGEAYFSSEPEVE